MFAFKRSSSEGCTQSRNGRLQDQLVRLLLFSLLSTHICTLLHAYSYTHTRTGTLKSIASTCQQLHAILLILFAFPFLLLISNYNRLKNV